MRKLEKTLLAMLATLALAAPVAAQEHKHEQKHDMKGMKHDMKDMMKMEEGPWKELNAFHSMLHESHHPLMQSKDLTPARQHAEHLATAAEAWAASSAPAECSAVEMEEVRGLAVDARTFAKLVAANGADDEVKTALNALHERFGAVHKACPPKGKAKP